MVNKTKNISNVTNNMVLDIIAHPMGPKMETYFQADMNISYVVITYHMYHMIDNICYVTYHNK